MVTVQKKKHIFPVNYHRTIFSVDHRLNLHLFEQLQNAITGLKLRRTRRTRRRKEVSDG